MVNKILKCGASYIAAVLIGVAVLYWSKSDRPERSGVCHDASVVETVPAHGEESLTEEDVVECSLVFEGLGKAYSNLQYEAMQELFCSISNKIARLGKDRIGKVIAPLKTPFREAFWCADRNLLDFASVPEFDRYMKTNISAVRILGGAIVANDFYDNKVLHYDMVAFRGIEGYMRKFKENGNEQLALSAQRHLDEWKEYLAAEQSLTRVYLRHQLMGFLKWPRWRAEDLGMKSKNDWIGYMRNFALKFHEQNYGIVPKWLDEEFPLPQNGVDIKTNPEKAQ